MNIMIVIQSQAGGRKFAHAAPRKQVRVNGGDEDPLRASRRARDHMAKSEHTLVILNNTFDIGPIQHFFYHE